MNIDAVDQLALNRICESCCVPTLEHMIRAARRAPSGDNLQPWSVRAGADGRSIEISLDPSRDLSPMNSGQRMSLIACGAAVQNAYLVAVESGWKTEIELPANPSLILARITLGDSGILHNPERILRLIADRVSNRRVYNATPLSTAELRSLRRVTAPNVGAECHWIGERTHINALAKSVGRADAIMFGEPSMRRAFLSNVRFDLPPKAQASSGLPLAALEANALLSTGLRMMRRIPAGLFSLSGGRAAFAAHARKLVNSASGLCVVTVDEGLKHVELIAGRATQSAWLALTERGFAVQPMMSLLVLDNALRYGAPELVAALRREKANVLCDEFQHELRQIGIAGRPAFLLRFGFAAAPTGRTGRLELGV